MKVVLRAGVCLVAIAFCFNVNAQIYRVIAGISLSNMIIEPEPLLDAKLNSGLLLGATLELPVSRYLSVETGLMRSPKGFKQVTVDKTSSVTLKTKYLYNPVYLDIILNAKGVYQTGKARFMLSLGPFVGIGTSGTEKTIHYENGSRTSWTSAPITWGAGEDKNLKRFDFGLTIGAGCEIRSFLLGMFYEIGFPDVARNAGPYNVLKNRVLGISLSYKILSL